MLQVRCIADEEKDSDRQRKLETGPRFTYELRAKKMLGVLYEGDFSGAREPHFSNRM